MTDPNFSNEPAGFIVLIWEHGAWHDNWDGEVHPDRTAGDAALAKAHAAGYPDAILTAAVPVGPPALGLDDINTASRMVKPEVTEAMNA